jgi:hypothetical protein
MKINSSARMSSEAWLTFPGYINGIFPGYTDVPGELKLADGRLSFIAFGCGTIGKDQAIRVIFSRILTPLRKRRLSKLELDAHRPGLADQINGGENPVVFELPITDVEVQIPWYCFECGLMVRVGGVQYHFSFGDPRNVVYRVSGSHNVLGMLNVFKAALKNYQEADKRRHVGKAWKNALSEIGLLRAVNHTGS